MNVKIPDSIKLKAGEYEIIIVINTIPLQIPKKRKLTFSEHNYCFENNDLTVSRANI
jgi:hypothetical protein